jgi:hypothetical protein
MDRVSESAVVVNREQVAGLVVLPTLGEPVEDRYTLAWRATDSDGITYWGQSALDVERQFAAELMRLAVAAGEGDFWVITERGPEEETEERPW